MSLKIEFVERAANGEKVAVLCWEFGVSRQAGHKWIKRFKGTGVRRPGGAAPSAEDDTAGDSGGPGDGGTRASGMRTRGGTRGSSSPCLSVRSTVVTPSSDREHGVEDATILKGEQITIHTRFRGGATTSVTVPRPLTYFEERRTQSQLVSEIDELLAEHHDAEVAKILVDRDRKPGGGGTFDVARVAFIRTTYNLKPAAAILKGDEERRLSIVPDLE